MHKVNKLFEEANPPKFVHKENDFNDFEKEILVPYQQSTLGPFLSYGDANGDGLEDVFIGGAKGQSGQIYFQQANGAFNPSDNHFDAKHEDMGSHLFDGDGDLDLYVASSGNDFQKVSLELQDRLYMNDGKRNFTLNSSALPKIADGGSRVKSIDFDNDGDLDLFVGGRLIPQNYPNIARSYLLENDNGQFTDVTAEKAAGLTRPGLVNDFLWTDLNGDGKTDIVLAGEWMPVLFFENTANGFEDKTSSYSPEGMSGWWLRMHQTDIDGDGDLDIVLGNIGLNTKFSASPKKPLKVYANDFDDNGTCDVVLAKEYKGKTVPVRGRQCSSDQMPFILDKFKTYGEFASASLEDIYTPEKLTEGVSLEIQNLHSGILVNEGTSYAYLELPMEAQSFPIQAIISRDINNDGRNDLILAGNIYNMEIETPRQDAGDGLVLMNKGDMKFEVLKSPVTGLYAPGDVKDMVLLNAKTGKAILIVTNNNGSTQMFAL